MENPHPLNGQSETKLAKAVKSLKEVEVPKGPREDVRRELSVLFAARKPVSARTRSLFMKPMFQFTSALAIVGTVTCLLLMPPGIGVMHEAFAEMQSRVLSAKSISYNVSVTRDEEGDAESGAANFPVKSTSSRIILLDSGVWRRETASYISITDPASGKQLQLVPKSKEATLVEIGPQDKSPDIRECVRLACPSDEVEETVLGERPALFFVVDDGNNAFPAGTSIWVDKQSRLPMKIAFPKTDGVTMTWTEFRFDEELDANLFQLTAPDGYNYSELKN